MKNHNFIFEQNLPKPLTKEETYYYFEKYHQGDLTAREIIITHNIRLVLYQVLNLFSKTSHEKDELLSIGLIGLIKSVDTFDLKKNVIFFTYAIRCINNEILMFMRKSKRYLNNQSIYTPIAVDQEGYEMTLEDTLEDETANFIPTTEKKVIYQEIKKIIQTLSKRDKIVVLLHFGFIDDKLYTQKEIAKKLNLSQSYVAKLIVRVVRIIGTSLIESEVFEPTKKMKRLK